MPVRISNHKISALIDTGSSINVISVQLYNSIPDSFKTKFTATNEYIILANNQRVQIYGTADIKVSTPNGKHWINVYILAQTSHPLILGTSYLISHKVILDFTDLSGGSKHFKVKTQHEVSIPPNTEILVRGKKLVEKPGLECKACVLVK